VRPSPLHDAVEKAFDYRGNVTLTTRDGQTTVGFVFNRVCAGVAEPYLECFVKGAPEPRRIRYQDLTDVALSGDDAAAGRSWEAWLSRVAEKKQAAAEGRPMTDIEPQVLPLD
jgi:hypothetical protein